MTDDEPGETPDQPVEGGAHPPPPSPYAAPPGAAPYPPPPPGYPAYPAGAEHPAASRTGGNGRIWLGIACAIPVLFVTSVLAGVIGSVDQLAWLAGLVGLAAFVGPIVLLFFDRFRKFALGLLIGYAVLLILAAGACIALITTYN